MDRSRKTFVCYGSPLVFVILLSGCGSGGQDGEIQNWVRTNHDKFFRTHTEAEIDQKWEPPPANCTPSSQGAHQILVFQPTGQEFKPTQSVLAAIELWLNSANTPHQDRITVKVRELTIAGPVLATASTIVGEVNGWQRFDLPTPIHVVPGELHVIDVSATNQSHEWVGGSCGQPGFEDYPGGAWIRKAEG